jgi:hypothetical protein
MIYSLFDLLGAAAWVGVVAFPIPFLALLFFQTSRDDTKLALSPLIGVSIGFALLPFWFALVEIVVGGWRPHLGELAMVASWMLICGAPAFVGGLVGMIVGWLFKMVISRL